MLEVENVDVYYGSSYVVRGVSLAVNRGEIVALLGRNGAGKTTTLKAVMGIVRPRRGRVLLGGTDVTAAPPYIRARRGMGYVPQGRLLFDSLSVEQNLVAVSREGRESREWVFEMFPLLKDRGRQKAGTLSGGEQQMLAIARALTNRPQFLLLDEPSTGLMPSVLEPLKATLRQLREGGIGIVLVEEKVPFALELATRGYVLETGAIVHEGDAASFRDEELLVRHLGVARSGDSRARGGSSTAARTER
jgi:ABC-type branched-subunit amino acid transport system ATPase component